MQVPSPMIQSMNARSPYAPRPPITPPRAVFESPPTLPGSYVVSEEDIVPGNVPMDGSISFFPSKDLSKIFIRQWNKYGDLERLTYTLERPAEPPPAVENPVPVPEPQSQQPPQLSKSEEAIVTVLNSLNQGLAASFGQFGQTLQSMQQSIDSISDRLDNLPDGGMG